jgi:hypothetical protein
VIKELKEWSGKYEWSTDRWITRPFLWAISKVSEIYGTL